MSDYGNIAQISLYSCVLSSWMIGIVYMWAFFQNNLAGVATLETIYGFDLSLRQYT